MKFTEDWFTHDIPNFELCMNKLKNRICFLEIGSYEGRSACWLLQHGLADDGSLVCIDPFVDMPEIQQRFENNIKKAGKPNQVVGLFFDTSEQALARFLQQKEEFDFIYIDGDHSPATTLTDACMAWPLLRSGGVMLFDDYQYPHEPTKVGIDAFLAAFEGQYEIIINNYQLGVQKK